MSEIPSGQKKIVTRFAPSPTGLLHVGSVRTALFSSIFAQQHDGSFMLRIEDTDKERSKPEYEVDIVDGIDWLGLDYGPLFYRQSEREATYTKYLEQLISTGKAYVSHEDIKNSKNTENLENAKNTHGRDASTRRSEVIRFKNPNKKIIFQDLIRGEIEFDTTELKDFVIAKSLTEPLYHLAVVIDDFESGVTHIIRGEDHLSNTPRQILIQEAIGAPRPLYAHLPLILAPDRAKLSKRKHGEKVSLRYYINKGYLKDALINYMALLGWNPGTDQEIFTYEELIKFFSLSNVQKSGAIFNEEKLRWINKQHMLKLPQEELYARIKESLGFFEVSAELLKKISPLILERISAFGDIPELVQAGEFNYFTSQPSYEVAGLLWKGKGDIYQTRHYLEAFFNFIKSLDENNFNHDIIKQAVWEYATLHGRGEVLWPMRYALSGREKSPDPFVIAEVLGKHVTLERLVHAIKKIS